MGVMVVTGGGRGIGAATARLAARRGYDVCINYAGNQQAAEQVAQSVRDAGCNALIFRADVTDRAAVEAMLEETEKKLGPVSALVNSAGLTGRSSLFLDMDMDEAARVIDVNVTGLMLTTQVFANRMARSRGGNGGAIVNISSVAATIGSSGEFVCYAASKAAVDTFTIGFAREVADDGIRINAVAPGVIDTEIHANAGDPGRPSRLAPTIPMKRVGQPEEVANAVLWLLSDEASYVTGSILRAGGGR